MANFSDFSDGGYPGLTDFMVGYRAGGGSGSDRRWRMDKLGASIGPFANVLAFGATGDGVTDDSTAIQAAIDSLTGGGTVYFPAAYFAIGNDTAITLPEDKIIRLVGSGRGDDTGTKLVAIETISAMISSGNQFFRSHVISDMTLDGAQLADYNLYMPYVDDAVFAHLYLQNAKVTNFLLGDTGGVNNVQGNLIFDINMTNEGAANFAAYPAYNLELNGTDNTIMHMGGSGARTANFYAHHASNNMWYRAHAAGGNNGTANYGFQIDTGGNLLNEWQCDGCVVANVYLNSYGNNLIGGISQFDSVTPAVHVSIANGVGHNLIAFNNFSDTTNANCIVQTGTAGGAGNFYLWNFNGDTSETVLCNRTETIRAVADLPTASAALAGSRAIVNNATATTFNSVVAATGANIVPVFCDGTNWRIG